ncbi:hypothetical protein [Candidatus Mesenet endosymbiont of Agriotes lineatus]|uniref:hypothetical protein n=1 Tax=Candidatus Mesenet endosymbiont of Agriotes lineatus TaxID=3077948 RepID=UPI0030D08934
MSQNNPILKFDQKAVNDYCFSLILKSEDGQDVATFPSQRFLFEKSSDKTLFRIESMQCDNSMSYRAGEIDLKVYKSNLGKLKADIVDDNSGKKTNFPISLDAIKVTEGTNLESYVNKEIHIKPGNYETETSMIADLYNAENKKIGELADTKTYIYGRHDFNEAIINFISAPLLCDFRGQNLPNVTVSKVDGKYKLQPVNTSVSHNKIGCLNAMLDLDNLNVDYDILNKLYGEEVSEITNVEGLKNQIKVLSQEKSQCETQQQKLIQEKSQLNDQVSNLTKEKENLTQEKSSLLSQKEELSNQISKLTEQSKTLCNELDETQFAINETQHDYMNLI